jgi:hypothetical protein
MSRPAGNFVRVVLCAARQFPRKDALSCPKRTGRRGARIIPGAFGSFTSWTPDALGASVTLDGKLYTVVGIRLRLPGARQRTGCDDAAGSRLQSSLELDRKNDWRKGWPRCTLAEAQAD